MMGLREIARRARQAKRDKLNRANRAKRERYDAQGFGVPCGFQPYARTVDCPKYGLSRRGRKILL